MKQNVFFQCLLCSFLLIVTIIIGFRSNRRTAEAGAFGITEFSNDTFEDLSLNLFEEFFNE